MSRASPLRSWSRLSLGVAFVALGTLGCPPPEEVDFESHEASVFSQNGEDGVIRKVFELIEPTRHFAVEFGAADGLHGSNVRNLVVHEEWDAFMMEGDAERAQECAENYAAYPGSRCIQAWVYPGNVELLFEENGVPKDLDLLVIDIDSNDWYVWRVIHDFRPKLVLIEYNGLFAPPIRMVVDFHPLNYWDGSSFFGASIQSLYELGKKKGYELIYVDSNGVNLFFVDAIYYERFGIRDNSPEKLFLPYQGRLSFGPDRLSELVDDQARPLPPYDRDLVWDEFRIEKRFLIDQR